MIKVGNYRVTSTLGSGLTSSVYLGKLNEESDDVAIKVPSRRQVLQDPTIQDLLAHEYSILSQLRHRHVIQPLDFARKELFLDAQRGFRYLTSFLVLEPASQGELSDLITSSGKLDDQTARFYFWQILDAIDYVHCKGFAHRDIKLENLVLDSNYDLKLVDFAFACSLKSTNYRIVGTDLYIAPEVFGSRSFDFRKTDIFALGVVLYVLVLGTQPFASSRMNDRDYRLLVENPARFWTRKMESESFLELPESLKELLKGILHPDPRKRWGVKEIVLNEWYNQEVDEFEVKDKLKKILESPPHLKTPKK